MPIKSEPGPGPLPRLRAGPSRRGLALVLALAFAGLAMLALFVTFGLPAYVAPSTVVAPATVAAPPVPAERRGPDASQGDADRLLAEALRRVARLEGEGARIWARDVVGGTSFPHAQAELDKASALHDRRQYAESLPVFNDVIARLDRLAETKSERFRLALASGQKALSDLDAPLAVAQLEIAVAIDSGQPQARLLERARALPEVLEKLTQGERAEAAGDLPGAREGYAAAVRLDPDFEPARTRLGRVEALIATSDYRAAVSEGFARLNEGNLRGAQSALDRARRINPRAGEIEDLRQRISVASQTAALDRLRVQSEQLERQEKWSDALKVYDQAAALDANAAFVSRGRARAQHLSQLHAAIDQYLSEPSRLQSSDPRAHAKTLIAQAGASGEPGQVLATKRQQLAQLIAVAETPVPVLLKSDRNTDVELYRVGKLGTFETRRLDLPPGKYTAVGSRAGFRDVRVQFEIMPASREETVTIQCTEAIR